MAGTSDVGIIFIEEAFVMKIIEPDSNSWMWHFMSHAELAQIKNVGKKTWLS